MRMELDRSLPILPLLLDDVPPALEWMLDQEGIPWERQHPTEPRGQFVLYDSARKKRPKPFVGQAAIDVAPLRVGHLRDPFDVYLDTTAAVHTWRIDGFELREEISAVDRQELRTQLLSAIRKEIEERGGLWLRKADAPYPLRSFFCLRLDHDEFVPDDFQAVMNALRGYEHAVSHYVCGSSYEGFPQALARLKGMHVGGHGYWHHTYRSPAENRENIARGLDVLRKGGLEPDGFVAPHGKCPAGLLAVLGELGMRHSSEFGLAYDDRPFFPPGSEVLQIPTHPVCLGLFLDALKPPPGAKEATPRGVGPQETRKAVESAARYFEDYIAAAYRTGEPAIVYCHPDGRLGRHPQVVRRILAAADRMDGLWKTNLAELTDWWKLRQETKVTVYRRADGLVTAREGAPAGSKLALELWRGTRVALLPLTEPAGLVRWDGLVFERREERPARRHLRHDRPHDLREQFRRHIDWEKTTPVGAIRRNSWQGWAKWILRTWQGSAENES